MKDQQPDKLFREKLSGYERNAPAGAWDRIESGLARKKYPYLKFAVAAAVLLLCVVTTVLWINEGPAEGPIAHSPKVTTPKTETPQKDPGVTADNKQDTKSDIPTDLQTTESESDAKVARRPSVKEKTLPVQDEAQLADNLPDQADAGDSKKSQKDIPGLPENTRPTEELADLSQDESLATNDKTITIVMTAAETSEYLTKNNLAEATSDGKKTSTLKKMLKKATELKNNDQDPLGDLRQMKNEILALNFKSEKQRGQNK